MVFMGVFVFNGISSLCLYWSNCFSLLHHYLSIPSLSQWAALIEYKCCWKDFPNILIQTQWKYFFVSLHTKWISRGWLRIQECSVSKSKLYKFSEKQCSLQSRVGGCLCSIFYVTHQVMFRFIRREKACSLRYLHV